MPLIKYQDSNLQPLTLDMIAKANSILDYYAGRGIAVTLRQLYYRFVALNLFPRDWADPKTGSTNNIRSYKRLGDMVNKARLCGLIDWSYLQDNARNLSHRSHFSSPIDAIDAVTHHYARDLWWGQDNYVEVWVEKDALISIVQPVCYRWDVPVLACRGYVSQSEMWGAGQRYYERMSQAQSVTIIHLGDHDPSGIDMSRDIEDRLLMFTGYHTAQELYKSRPQTAAEDREAWVERLTQLYKARMGKGFKLDRIALNMDQIQLHNPPPNYAKVTDSRYDGYVREYGEDSWELDSLEPEVLEELLDDSISNYILDRKLYDEQIAIQERERDNLKHVSRSWDKIQSLILAGEL